MIKVICPLGRQENATLVRSKIKRMMGGISHCVFISKGCLVYQNRNHAIANGSLDGYTHVLCVDSDIEFCENDIRALLSRNKPVVGAKYEQRDKRGSSCASWPHKPENVPLDACGCFEVSMVGAGALLVQSEATARH